MFWFHLSPLVRRSDAGAISSIQKPLVSPQICRGSCSSPTAERPLIYADSEYFHPTFLYESIWNLALFALLFSLFRLGQSGRMQLPAGSLSCLYLVGYSIGRVWIEGLRIDPLCIEHSHPPAKAVCGWLR